MVSPERKLKYLAVYLRHRIDMWPNKPQAFDLWLAKRLEKSIKKGVELVQVNYRKKCAYCSRSFTQNHVEKTRDHIVPISRGGLNVPENKAPCCHDCNLWKADKMPSVWLNEIERLLRKGKNISLPYNEGLLKLMAGKLRSLIKRLKENKKKVSVYDF